MGVQLTIPRGSRVTGEELLREVDEYFVAGATVSSGQTVFDVGANIGAFALRAAERCNGDLRLFCFEPAPDTYGALEKNFEAQEVLKKGRHSLQPVGLSSPNFAGQTLAFYNFSRVGTNSTFDVAGKRREFEIFFEDRSRRLTAWLGPLGFLGRPFEWFFRTTFWRVFIWWFLRHLMGFQEVRAKVETLASVLKREQIETVHLLKVDVEGAELDVLLGLDAETWPRVQQVVMETHNRDGRQDTIEALLRANGLGNVVVTAQRTIDNGLESVIVCARR